MRVLSIVSGGQTGVDRGALDAALSLGIPCGGRCPQGRRAEDGPIPAHYPLIEMPTLSYAARTQRNVMETDGTLVITFGVPTAGTRLTVECCAALRRPHLIVDATVTAYREALQTAALFIDGHGIRRLNVAGPRASIEPRGHAYARRLITDLVQYDI